MTDPTYLDRIKSHFAQQNWNLSINQLDDDTYVVGGTRDNSEGQERIAVMVVIDSNVNEDHIDYLLKIEKQENPNQIILTTNSSYSEEAQRMVDERNILVLEKSDLDSRSKDEFEMSPEEVSINEDETESSSQPKNTNKADIPKEDSETSESQQPTRSNSKSSDSADGSKDDDTIVWKTSANRTVSNRAVGGELILARNKLVFEPNSFGSDSDKLIIPVSDITEIGEEDRFSGNISDTLLGGGLQARLRIRTSDGKNELFVVDDVQEAISIIESNANNIKSPSSTEIRDSSMSTDQDSESEEISTWDLMTSTAGAIINIIVVLVVISTVIGLLTPISIPIFDSSDAIAGIFSDDAPSTDPDEEIGKSAPELILTLDDMDSGWQGGVSESNQTFARAEFANPDQIASKFLIVELTVHSSISDAREVYEEEESDITERIAVSESDLGHEAVVWEEGDGAAVYFRDSEVTALVSFADSTETDPEGKATDFAAQLIENF